MDIRETRYARTEDGAFIAYQVVGEGPVDLACLVDVFGNLDVLWQEPDAFGPLFRGLAESTRLILHDRRATGLSSRNVDAPNLETRVDDLRAVLDAVGSDRPAILGMLEGGAPGAMLAATDPSRVSSFIWYGPQARQLWAPDYPWGVGPEHHERNRRALELWGTPGFGRLFADTNNPREVDGDDLTWLDLLSRQTCTPDVAAEMERVWYETDVRELLPAIRAPSLLIQHEDDSLGSAETDHIASLMPDASVSAVPGVMLSSGMEHVVETVRAFLGTDVPHPELETVLAAVMFTDIVDSTRIQAEASDRGWKELVLKHHAVVRDALTRWRGIENDTAGDGFYATFDGPARAIRCALEIVERVHDLGIEVRAGIHTGECEVIDAKLGGLTVSIGARVAGLAGPSDVLVSQTVRDLVAGSGLAFENAGERELKGVPDRWRLYRVVSG
ncbi:MAG: adenylate/guanylate cyclase domain-containing protein [Actinomycetota bacterium]